MHSSRNSQMKTYFQYKYLQNIFQDMILTYNLRKFNVLLSVIQFIFDKYFVHFPDMCYQRLGLEDGRLPDSSLSASSSYDEASVGPQNAR